MNSFLIMSPFKRNKAALTLFWDLNTRNHEVTLLKIKHIRLREKYGEGEIPHEATILISDRSVVPLLFRSWIIRHIIVEDLEELIILFTELDKRAENDGISYLRCLLCYTHILRARGSHFYRT